MLHSPTHRHLSPVPLSPGRRWLILAIVSAALLLIVVDMTVLYTALPRLTHDLQASASDKLWIINSYALVVSGLLLGMGTLGDRLGHKRLFLSGLAMFGVASVAAAYSPNPAFLIAARAFLGVAAAMMMPATLSLIRITFHDERERAVAFGVWSSIASGGAAFGPVLGGFLLEHFWWGSVFLINVPIVLIALPMGWLLVPRSTPDSSRPWDIKGSVLIMVGLVASTLAIKEMGKLYTDWGLTAGALVVGVLFLGWFVRQQNRSPFPLLDFALFKNATLSTAVLSALSASAALIGMELVFSQRLQLVLGFSPLQAGPGHYSLAIGRIPGRSPSRSFADGYWQQASADRLPKPGSGRHGGLPALAQQCPVFAGNQPGHAGSGYRRGHDCRLQHHHAKCAPLTCRDGGLCRRNVV